MNIKCHAMHKHKDWYNSVSGGCSWFCVDTARNHEALTLSLVKHCHFIYLNF